MGTAPLSTDTKLPIHTEDNMSKKVLVISSSLRSIVTITALISKGITDSSLKYHLSTARTNGVTRSEMAEILTHIAFYAGWPNAWAAFRMAKEVYADDSAVESHGGFFGLGKPNDAYAQYFTGRSFLKPLTVPGETVFLANVTFEPGCRKLDYVA